MVLIVVGPEKVKICNFYNWRALRITRMSRSRSLTQSTSDDMLAALNAGDLSMLITAMTASRRTLASTS